MSTISAEIGARIRSIREGHGWSQGEFAAKVGIGQREVSYWERGEREMSVAQIVTIADVFGLKPGWLIDGKDDRPYVSITFDPAMRSGQPTVNHTRLSAEAVVGMLSAGEDVATVADEYHITRADVLCAAWYVGTYGLPGLPSWKRDLREWAKEAAGPMWHASECDYDAIPDPPIGEAEPGRTD